MCKCKLLKIRICMSVRGVKTRRARSQKATQYPVSLMTLLSALSTYSKPAVNTRLIDTTRRRV